MARQQGNISAKKVSTAKKIDPAPSQLNNTAEMRDWYQKNKDTYFYYNFRKRSNNRKYKCMCIL